VDQVDDLIQEHLEPEVAERLAGAITLARARPVLLLSDANHDGTFGLLLLTEDGIEFLAPDGRVVVKVRDDILMAEPGPRGALAVTFTDGAPLTFTDVGDGTWTKHFAQAINVFAAEGASAPQFSAAEASVPTADAEPFPQTVVGIIDGVAGVGLALGLLAGIGAVVAGFTGDDTDAAAVLTGGAIIVFSALQWAFFKAVSLGLTYLWRIQFELAHKAEAD
jgi:hypothetical protein